MRLVIAKLGFEPVLWKQEDFMVGFPYTVVLHPFLLFGVDDEGMNLGFQIEQTALDEQL